MSSIFIIAYDVPRPSAVITSANNYWHRAEGTPQTLEVAVNPHFIGRFQQPTYQRVKYLPSTDLPTLATVETNTHFVGRYNQPVFNRAIQSWDVQGTTQVIDTVGANPHFVGKFQAPIYNRIRTLPENEGLAFVQEIEVNPHFLGTYTNPVYQRIKYSPDNQGLAFVQETTVNPHFIGRFTSPTYQRAIISPNIDTVVIIPPAETQPHFIGKFTPSVFTRPIQSWSTDGQPFVVDTVGANSHFIGRFTPSQHKLLYQDWQNIATDIPVIIFPETNTSHFLPSFYKPVVFYTKTQPFLYSSWDTSESGPIPPVITSTPSGRYMTEEELDAEYIEAMNKWNRRINQSYVPKVVEDISKIASKLGKLGGHAKAATMTAKQRSQHATKMAGARWR